MGWLRRLLIAGQGTRLEGALAVTEGRQVTSGDLLKDSLASKGILVEHASGAKHGKTAVLELLELQLVELGLIGWADVGRVPAEIPRAATLALNRRVEHFDGGNSNEDLPQGARGLGVDLRHGVQGVGVLGDEAGDPALLGGALDPDAEGSKHAHTAVLELGSAVPAEGILRLALGKANRVPEAANLGGRANQATAIHGDGRAAANSAAQRGKSGNCQE